MICQNCRFAVPNGARFCNNCGRPMAAQPMPPRPVQPMPPRPVQPVRPVQPRPVQPVQPRPVQPVQPVRPVQPVQPRPVPPVQPVQPKPVQPVPPYQPAQPPKKRKKGLLIGLIAGGAALLVLLGVLFFFLLGSGDEPTGNPGQASRPTTAPNSRVELENKEAELVFKLQEADVDKFYTLLEQCEKEALANTKADKLTETYEALDDQYMYLSEQHSIAMVLYYCDLKDEEASQLYLDCTETLTQANNDYLQMLRDIYLNENVDQAVKDVLLEDYTERDLKMLRLYTEEIMRLQQRNSEIEVAYQDLQDDPNMNEKMVPLYVEMVQNNNRIATIYGYDNYYTYAYEMTYDRDYGPDEVEAMRTYAAEYLTDAVDGALEKTIDGLGSLTSRQKQQVMDLVSDGYSQEDISCYLSSLPSPMRDEMQKMWNGDLLDKTGSYGAMEGAFTASIGEERTVCFFGPGYGNSMTYVHEVGHYYGSQHTFLDEIPLDLAETHSQGNEWLFLSYMGTQMPVKLHTVAVDYKTYTDMTMILVCLMVDEFEQKVYSHPNPAALTGAELDSIMAEVCQRYGGVAYVNMNYTDIQSYWRMVVVEQPVYYISYAVSSIAAINIFSEAQESYYGGVEVYRSLVEDTEEDELFLAATQKAGLSGPFDEKVYQDLAKRYQ